MKISYEISLDFSAERSGIIIPATNGDVNTRIIYVTITNKNLPFSLDEIATAVIVGKKPDKKKFKNECEIIDNKILVSLTSQMTAAAGLVDCQIILYGKDGSISPTAKFQVKSYGVLDHSGIESTNEYTLLQSLTREYKLYRDIRDTEIPVEVIQENDLFYMVNRQGKKLGVGMSIRGSQGERGPQGIQGPVGMSAYELWLSQGNTGDAHDFYRQALGMHFSEDEPETKYEGLFWFKMVRPKLTVTDGLLLHFDANSIEAEDNSKITAWKDISGNGFDIAVPSGDASYSPTFLKTGLHGRPTVKFSGGQHLEYRNFALPAHSGFTLFSVFELDNTTASQCLAVIGTRSQAIRTLFLRHSSSGQGVETYINEVIAGYTAISLTNGNPYFIHTSTWDGATVVSYRNGLKVNQSTVAGTSINAHDFFRIGASTNGSEVWYGRMSEFLFYPRVLTSTERSEVETYLKKRWGV